ncbi:MAG TPA: CHAD domain-containing protein [Candidatus Methylacidiphilales bacterium]
MSTPASSARGNKEALRLEGYLWAEMKEARRHLASTPASRRAPGTAIHAARRAIKRLRAGLRLAHGMFRKKDLAPVEGPLRNAARLLGPLRDRTVLANTARKLGARPPSFPPLPASGRMREAAREAALAARALRRLSWTGLDPGFLARGVRRLYKKGRQALREAEARPAADSFHTWRKRTKDFVHALEAAGPRTIRKGPKALKKGARLASALGDEHDLAVFIEKAAKEKPALRRRAAKKEKRLRKRTLRQGRALFGRKPKKLVRR